MSNKKKVIKIYQNWIFSSNLSHDFFMFSFVNWMRCWRRKETRNLASGWIKVPFIDFSIISAATMRNYLLSSRVKELPLHRKWSFLWFMLWRFLNGIKKIPHENANERDSAVDVAQAGRILDIFQDELARWKVFWNQVSL